MKLHEIETPVTSLSGVGPSLARSLSQLDIFTIADLLSHWPCDWEDRSTRVSLCQYELFPKVHTLAKVVAHSWFGYGRMRTLKILIDDGTAQAELVCFNRPFMANSLPVDSLITVTGHFSVKYGGLQSATFDAQIVSTHDAPENPERIAHIPGSGILPLYPLTAGVSQLQIRKLLKRALQEYGKGIENELPADVMERNALLSKKQALFAMHTPKTIEEAQQGRKTLIFEELFQFQLAIGRRSIERRGSLPVENAALSSEITDAVTGRSREQTALQADGQTSFERSLSPRQKLLKARLSFELTDDQKKVILEMNTDIDRGFLEQTPFSMARLLQGDVGSGKTLVAFFAALRVIDYGGQTALLAPTELLSRQHAENAARLLEGTDVRLAFLTGNTKAAGRKLLLDALKKGEIQLVVGTHALFSDPVAYKNLRLAIIDEQHRFGVLQRNAIMAKGRNPFPPHLLMMSATPIPQTLALTVFGDLDVSVIRTMPKGRKPIRTFLSKLNSSRNVFDFVRKELQAGRQAYFVYPLIEGFGEDDSSRHGALKDAESMYVHLKEKIFPEFAIALIHSRVGENEQRDIMESFRKNETQILVATSVVEVGVDVPNATCMVIEHAERFGLAALHQLRGRVGRGEHQSYCILVYADNLTEFAKSRLKALHEHTDGFMIAEEDLILRGPGEVLGVQQSGYLTLSIADPVRDSELLQTARKEAFAFLRTQQTAASEN